MEGNDFRVKKLMIKTKKYAWTEYSISYIKLKISKIIGQNLQILKENL